MHPQTGVRGEKLKSTIKPYSWQPILSIGFIGTSFFFFFSSCSTSVLQVSWQPKHYFAHDRSVQKCARLV